MSSHKIAFSHSENSVIRTEEQTFRRTQANFLDFVNKEIVEDSREDVLHAPIVPQISLTSSDLRSN